MTRIPVRTEDMGMTNNAWVGYGPPPRIEIFVSPKTGTRRGILMWSPTIYSYSRSSFPCRRFLSFFQVPFPLKWTSMLIGEQSQCVGKEPGQNRSRRFQDFGGFQKACSYTQKGCSCLSLICCLIQNHKSGNPYTSLFQASQVTSNIVSMHLNFAPVTSQG